MATATFHPGYEDAQGGLQAPQDASTPGPESVTTFKGGSQYMEINKSTGRAPSRCTDCICFVLFVMYMGVMVYLPLKAKFMNGADLNRLTNGVDFQGQICGIDTPNEYLFWCRANAAETSAVPEALDLDRPTCVRSCPKSTSDAQIECLQKPTIQQALVPFEALNTVKTNEIRVIESKVKTTAYATERVLGKYCVPVDSDLKRTVMHGPLFGRARILNMLGATPRTWTWIFLTVLTACVLSYTFLVMIKMCPKPTMYLVTVAAMALFWLLFIFCMLAIPAHPKLTDDNSWEWYTVANPVFERNNREDSVILCLVMAGFFLIMAMATTLRFCTMGRGLEQALDLIETANDCVWSIPTLVIQPVIFTFIQVALIRGLTSGLLELCSQGFIQKRRVIVDGERYLGYSALFHYDTWTEFWDIFLYFVGAAWALELTVSVGQYMVAFSVISWYFLKKYDLGKESRKPDLPLRGPNGLFVQAISSLWHHFGSLCLGSFLIFWARLWRMTMGLCWKDSHFENYEPSELMCASCCNGCCLTCYRCIMGDAKRVKQMKEAENRTPNDGLVKCCCNCVKGQQTLCFRVPWNCMCASDPFCDWFFETNGPDDKDYLCCKFTWDDVQDCTKDAYNDVIIRAADFLPAIQRSKIIFNSSTPCGENKGAAAFYQNMGIFFIPAFSMLCFIGLMQLDVVNDEANDLYVSDPVAIGWFTFCICILISYNFCMIFTHAADTLLYCYAWHNRFDKGSIKDFIPDKLRWVVGWADENVDKYPYYGRADHNMYLASFLDLKKKGKSRPTGDPKASAFFYTS